MKRICVSTIVLSVVFRRNYPKRKRNEPILIGHSMGGLIVQKLIEMDKGIVGICIDSAPPKGVGTSKGSFLKANLSVINPLKGSSVFESSVRYFHYAFCRTLTMEKAAKIVNDFVVPGSRNIPRSSTKKDGKSDFSKH